MSEAITWLLVLDVLISDISIYRNQEVIIASRVPDCKANQCLPVDAVGRDFNVCHSPRCVQQRQKCIRPIYLSIRYYKCSRTTLGHGNAGTAFSQRLRVFTARQMGYPVPGREYGCNQAKLLRRVRASRSAIC